MVLTRGALSLVAIALFAFALRLHLVASAAEEWSSTDGVVVASYVRRIGAGNAAEAGDTDDYSPIVAYEYRVGSDLYAGSRIGFADFFYTGYSAKYRVQTLPPGKRVTVYFDPNDANSAVLDRTYPVVAIVMLVGFAVFCLVGSALLPKLVQLAVNSLTARPQKT